MQYGFVTLILITTALVALHMMKHGRSTALSMLLVALALSSIFVYFNFGKMHYVIKREQAFVKETGSPVKRTVYHWHEHFHYYLGAKYYKELGHYGLYEAVALADSKSSRPAITVKWMRDLSRPTFPIRLEEGIRRGAEIWQPKFSPERWQEFTEDIAFFQKTADRSWFDTALFDAGFNAPPTWSLIGSTIANLVPVSYEWFNYGKNWDQFEFLSLFDILLIATACFFIYRSFGLLGLCVFLVVFGTSTVSSARWTGGAFFRQLWLFGLIMGICMLKKEKFLIAGAFLMFSACMRIFPIVFLAGAGLALFIRWYVQKDEQNWENLKKFSIGAASVFAVLFILSLLVFGSGAWSDFFDNINTHKDLFFVWHIGFRRIMVWADWVPFQNFWWEDGLNRFRHWNGRLVENMQAQVYWFYPFACFYLLAAAYAIRERIRPEEAALLFGGLVLYFFALPANYYYIYFAIIPVVFASRTDSWREAALLAMFFALWFFLYINSSLGGDDLIQNYRWCGAILIFFNCWLIVRLCHKDSRISKYMRDTINAK